MADDTECNFCTMKKLRARAARNNATVTVIKKRVGGWHGVDVYIHPALINPLDEEYSTLYFVAWLAVLPTECVCVSSGGEKT